LLLRSTEIRPHRPNDLLPPTPTPTLKLSGGSLSTLHTWQKKLHPRDSPHGTSTREQHRDTPRQRDSLGSCRDRDSQRDTLKLPGDPSTLHTWSKKLHPWDSQAPGTCSGRGRGTGTGRA